MNDILRRLWEGEKSPGVGAWGRRATMGKGRVSTGEATRNLSFPKGPLQPGLRPSYVPGRRSFCSVYLLGRLELIHRPPSDSARLQPRAFVAATRRTPSSSSFASSFCGCALRPTPSANHPTQTGIPDGGGREEGGVCWATLSARGALSPFTASSF